MHAQTTHFYHEARELIKEEVHGNDNDVVLFAGTGCTGAIAKLAHLLGVVPRSKARKSDAHRSTNTTATHPLNTPIRISNAETAGTAGTATFACQFPGCGRSFEEAGNLTLHARTHPDGDRASLRGGASNLTSSPADAAESGSSNGSAGGGVGVVVLVGPMEHHSNLLVWREADCTVVQIQANATGTVDVAELVAQLELHRRSATMLIGSFSAASNLTGR